MTDNIINFPDPHNKHKTDNEFSECSETIKLLYKINLIKILEKWPDDAVFALREIDHIPMLSVNSLDYETDRLGLKVKFDNMYEKPLSNM